MLKFSSRAFSNVMNVFNRRMLVGFVKMFFINILDLIKRQRLNVFIKNELLADLTVAIMICCGTKSLSDSQIVLLYVGVILFTFVCNSCNMTRTFRESFRLRLTLVQATAQFVEIFQIGEAFKH